MTRSIVCGALWVCSVAKTRWPVSAAVSAVAIVSRSRISPTRMTSGSWRSAARSASANVTASGPISRWLTMHVPCQWRNSIGSSIVRMCSCLEWLTWSSSEASVVDLPEPVGPVTRTRPRGLSANSYSRVGHVQFLERLDLGRDQAERRADARALEVGVDAEAREPRNRVREVELPARLEVSSAARSRGSGRRASASRRLTASRGLRAARGGR